MFNKVLTYLLTVELSRSSLDFFTDLLRCITLVVRITVGY